MILLPENQGLCNALRVAVLEYQNELIARMDSDDIAIADRFEKQIRFFSADESLAICGGQIEDTTNIVGRRVVLISDSDNHMTVIFRKSAVREVGNYRDWFWNEDYYLWIRMALAQMKFANLPNTLVYVRVGKDIYSRRGGKNILRVRSSCRNFCYEKNDRHTDICYELP